MPSINWPTKRFDECIDKIVCTRKIPKKDFLEFGQFPIVSQESKITNGYWNNQNDLFQIKKPVIIFGDHTQVLKFINFDFVLGADGVKILSPKSFLDPKFFYYCLQSFELKSLGYARHYRLLKGILIPTPPLTEQQRIVAILDKVFAGIEKTKENTKKNLQNAKELFESYLQSVFTNPGKDWEEKRLGTITSKIGSGATPKGGKKSYKEIGISLIRSMNVHDRRFKERQLAFIDNTQASDLSNVTLEKDDILINITGASVTRCCVLPAKYLPARVNQHVSIIRPQQEVINSTFLNYLLTSKLYKNRLGVIGAQGSTRQAITKVQLENFTITFPDSLPEQKHIVAQLDALSAKTKNLEAIYQQKLLDLEELKKSVLKKAFSGEL